MKILIGSDSKARIKILEDFFNGKDVKISSIKVSSGIDEQPLNGEIAIEGSINRAKNAIKNYDSDFDYAIGMEAGLEEIDGVYNLICVVTVINDKRVVKTTFSHPIPLPKEVSNMVSKGEEFGAVVREYSKKENSDIIQELISRKNSFTEALKLQWPE